jgi:hypothetical protein
MNFQCLIKLDFVQKSARGRSSVIPAQAGIQDRFGINLGASLGSGFRRSDEDESLDPFRLLPRTHPEPIGNCAICREFLQVTSSTEHGGNSWFSPDPTG